MYVVIVKFLELKREEVIALMAANVPTWRGAIVEIERNETPSLVRGRANLEVTIKLGGCSAEEANESISHVARNMAWRRVKRPISYTGSVNEFRCISVAGGRLTRKGWL